MLYVCAVYVIYNSSELFKSSYLQLHTSNTAQITSGKGYTMSNENTPPDRYKVPLEKAPWWDTSEPSFRDPFTVKLKIHSLHTLGGGGNSRD